MSFGTSEQAAGPTQRTTSLQSNVSDGKVDFFGQLIHKIQASGSKALKFREQVPLSDLRKRDVIMRDWCDYILTQVASASVFSNEERITMLMRMCNKVLEDTGSVASTSQVNVLAQSRRLTQYEEFKGFWEEDEEENKEITDSSLFETSRKIMNINMQSLIDFSQLKTAFAKRQDEIEEKIRVAKIKFDQVSDMVNIKKLTGFIDDEVSNKDLGDDIQNELNVVFQATLDTAKAQRSRTLQFFATELTKLKDGLVDNRKTIHCHYSRAKDILAQLPGAQEKMDSSFASENQPRAKQNVLSVIGSVQDDESFVSHQTISAPKLIEEKPTKALDVSGSFLKSLNNSEQEKGNENSANRTNIEESDPIVLLDASISFEEENELAQTQPILSKPKIRKLEIYSSSYDKPYTSFEHPRLYLIEGGYEKPQEVDSIEFNANFSVRGLQAKFVDGSASPFFGQVSSQPTQTVTLKAEQHQLTKIRTMKDFNQYLHRLEFYDKTKMYAWIGDDAENREEFEIKSNEVIVGIYGSSFDQFDQKKLKSLGFYVMTNI